MRSALDMGLSPSDFTALRAKETLASLQVRTSLALSKQTRRALTGCQASSGKKLALQEYCSSLERYASLWLSSRDRDRETAPMRS